MLTSTGRFRCTNTDVWYWLAVGNATENVFYSKYHCNHSQPAVLIIINTPIIFIQSEESYITQIEYGFDQHDVEIIDTAGQEEFMFFRDCSLAKGDAFLALFAINSLSSWYSLQELRKKIIREREGDDCIPFVVIANKSVS